MTKRSKRGLRPGVPVGQRGGERCIGIDEACNVPDSPGKLGC